jgi:hypothetical protein
MMLVDRKGGIRKLLIYFKNGTSAQEADLAKSTKKSKSSSIETGASDESGGSTFSSNVTLTLDTVTQPRDSTVNRSEDSLTPDESEVVGSSLSSSQSDGNVSKSTSPGDFSTSSTVSVSL